MPAKKPTQWMAPALPVFAGKPAPTGDSAGVSIFKQDSAHPTQ
ncbi:hypothetical protein PRJ_0513 [Pseudomonas sp. XWY-1]|nr:hypothetical protein PRJ_0513 [Pseudomonas sp. XWY-1]